MRLFDEFVERLSLDLFQANFERFDIARGNLAHIGTALWIDASIIDLEWEGPGVSKRKYLHRLMPKQTIDNLWERPEPCRAINVACDWSAVMGDVMFIGIKCRLHQVDKIN